MKQLICHVLGTFNALPSRYDFPTKYLCDAASPNIGLFDVTIAKDHVGRDAVVTVSMTGDAMSYSFNWNPPDPITGLQSFRFRVFDSTTGVLKDPDDIRITIERLPRI